MDALQTDGHAVAHVTGEVHHHHSHASSSHHAGGHHLLAVEHLSVAFDDYDSAAPYFSGARCRGEVLHDLTLSVHEGELLAVVGASGSGKTVLADALMGQYETNAEVTGSIWFDGTAQDAASLARLWGHGISLVPQGVDNLDPLMRVGDQVRGVPRGSSRAERRTDAVRRLARQRELFASYGLGEQVERLYPHQLSGGMARRVLLITHDIELALRVADRVAVFRDGTVVEETGVGSFSAPELLRHPFSRALWHALPSHDFATFGTVGDDLEVTR